MLVEDEGITMDNNIQKMKLHYLEKTLMNNTDERHPLTSEEIIKSLENDGVKVERKTFYKDIALLRDFGIDVIQEKRGRNVVYYIGQRDFELPELKLLVDLVQSSRFITKKKSQILIKKIESLASKYEAGELQRQVYVSNENKTENEKIYYNVDKIHSAINENRTIRFQYFQWDLSKKRVLKHEGKIYKVSPWALLWDHEKYYLIGYDEEIKETRHYRVDKIINLEMGDDSRKGLKEFKKLDMSVYTSKVFSMFDGEEEIVTLRADKSLAGVIIDRFGKNIDLNIVNDNEFDVSVKVALSNQFYGWVLSIGNDIRILKPKKARDGIREMIEQRRKIYEK